MSSHTHLKCLAAVALVIFQGGAAKASMVCPETSANQPLTGMSLFQGDPRDNIVLIPADPLTPNGYINDWPRITNSGVLIAVCLYKGGIKLQLKVPAGLGECRVDHTSVHTTALCW